jgi:hypothetical protein
MQSTDHEQAKEIWDDLNKGLSLRAIEGKYGLSDVRLRYRLRPYLNGRHPSEIRRAALLSRIRLALRLGFSQRQAAKALGLHYSTVWRMVSSAHDYGYAVSPCLKVTITDFSVNDRQTNVIRPGTYTLFVVDDNTFRLAPVASNEMARFVSFGALIGHIALPRQYTNCETISRPH